MKLLTGDLLTGEILQVLKSDSERYQWLKDNGHLDMWWSVQGPEDKSDNIDADIDEAMSEQKLKGS